MSMMKASHCTTLIQRRTERVAIVWQDKWRLVLHLKLLAIVSACEKAIHES